MRLFRPFEEGCSAAVIAFTSLVEEELRTLSNLSDGQVATVLVRPHVIVWIHIQAASARMCIHMLACVGTVRPLRMNMCGHVCVILRGTLDV